MLVSPQKQGLDAALLVFPPLTTPSFKLALRRAISIDTLVGQHMPVFGSSLRKQFVEYLIGHPFGKAKRWSTIHQRMRDFVDKNTDRLTPEELQLRHLCASFPGSSGSPVAMVAPPADGVMGGDAPIADVASQRSRSLNIVALHKAQCGRASLLSSIGDKLRASASRADHTAMAMFHQQFDKVRSQGWVVVLRASCLRHSRSVVYR